MWNKDLFEREGLPCLYEIYYSGDWTFEALMDVVDQAGRDTTGDGEIDRIGLALRREEDFIYANEADVFTIDDDGRAVVTFDQPEFMRAAEFMVDLYNHENTQRMDRYDMLDAFANGDIAMVTGQMCYKPRLMGNAVDWEGQERRLALMEDDYGLLPLPTGPDSDWWGQHETIIPVTFPVIAEDLDALVEMSGWVNRSMRRYYDVDTQDEELQNLIVDYLRDEESIEIFYQLWDTARLRENLRLPGRPERMARYVAEGTRDFTTIASGVDALRPEAQAFLDDMFGQEPVQ